MEKPKSLDSLFTSKIFRIPDYQRGYAWQTDQLKDFWEDLINLAEGREHYTGVLTLKEIPKSEVLDSSKEHWLVKNHSYSIYHIVDGQQRLTTFIIFVQAFVDLVKSLSENKGKSHAEIYVNESLSVADVESRYLFKVKPTGDQFRTYKFGYSEDNPSYDYLRYKILGENGAGTVQETFYTLNLNNAHQYFTGQMEELHKQEGSEGLREIYEKLTQQMMFNEYVIQDAFDVFVAFETMNNRGKKLSDLELLKNRLIYLTTLYGPAEMAADESKSLRDSINDAWKEVYHQLGRNKLHPLNDNDFLRAHWTMFFKYSRQTGQDYIRFLLEEQFSPKRLHTKISREVKLEMPEEVQAQDDSGSEEVEIDDEVAEAPEVLPVRLPPTAIRDFVNSLKESALHWFHSFYPELAVEMSAEERLWLDRLNRAGMSYFRPLVMSVLKNEKIETRRLRIFQKIERFIFLSFKTTSARSNYGSSEFYNFARSLDRNETNLQNIEAALDKRLDYTFDEDGSLRTNEFYNILFNKFKNGSGYYGWAGLRYFLYEYELSLLSESRQKKVDWSDLLKNGSDKISIEHIYPQTVTEGWSVSFDAVAPENRGNYNGTLGNLLLLSMSINSSLQNDSFSEKKNVKKNTAGQKVRNGYADGSHSETEVAINPTWGPQQIKDRGNKLLQFMEKRWGFHFKNDEDRERLLFLTFADQTE
jgi:hypothetical protein